MGMEGYTLAETSLKEQNARIFCHAGNHCNINKHFNIIEKLVWGTFKWTKTNEYLGGKDLILFSTTRNPQKWLGHGYDIDIEYALRTQNHRLKYRDQGMVRVNIFWDIKVKEIPFLSACHVFLHGVEKGVGIILALPRLKKIQLGTVRFIFETFFSGDSRNIWMKTILLWTNTLPSMESPKENSE